MGLGHLFNLAKKTIANLTLFMLNLFWIKYPNLKVRMCSNGKA